MSLSSHSFILQSVSRYLNDADVLTRLLAVCRSTIPLLSQYRLKQAVSPSFMFALHDRPNIQSNKESQQHSSSPVSVHILVSAVNGVESLRDLKAIRNHHYNSYITHLSFANSFNEMIPVATIPDSVTYIRFGVRFNQSLPVGALPSSLTHLTIGLGFRKQLDPNSIPSSVTHLTVNGQLVVIPSSVTHLAFGYDFNHVLPVGSIPSSVKQLSFGYRFNQPIFVGALPQSITHLKFGCIFDQPLLVGSIPSSVKDLTFGWDFNQPLVVGIIPNGVTHLTFGAQFNQPLHPGVLPSSITCLTFGRRFNQHLSESVIPSSVTHLTLGAEFNQPIKTTNNPTINEIIGLFNTQVDHQNPVSFVPDSITHLIVSVRPGSSVFGKVQPRRTVTQESCVVS